VVAMEDIKPTFSINIHDNHGDKYMDGIFLHFGPSIIKVSADPDKFKEFNRHLRGMEREISETYERIKEE